MEAEEKRTSAVRAGKWEMGELERVAVFKYLGRLLACDDNDTQAMRGTLAKAWKCWARVSCVLRAENTPPTHLWSVLQGNGDVSATVW